MIYIILDIYILILILEYFLRLNSVNLKYVTITNQGELNEIQLVHITKLQKSYHSVLQNKIFLIFFLQLCLDPLLP